MKGLSLMLNENLEIMTVEELMTLLYIGKNTAYELLATGQIEAFRIGRVWKIPRRSVTAYAMAMMNRQLSQATLGQ